MIFDPPLPRGGEIAVLGLGRSGLAVTELLRRGGASVYVSDSSDSEDVRDAAAKAKALGASVEAGKHDLDRIARASLLVVSPGISPGAPALRVAAKQGIQIVSEVEIALRALRRTRYIAVTGTNGKSTTTAMIAHLLRGLGATAVEAGNIGTPVSSIALSETPPAWLALEMSSFQLHDTPSIAPDVGVLTNLAPDHLDRYESEREYFADKELLFRNASDRTIWVTNADDAKVERMTHGIRGRRYQFSLKSDADAHIGKTGGESTLVLMGKPLMKTGELRILGAHNVANALAALLAVSVAHPRGQTADAHAKLSESLRTFPGLRHRLEIVAEKDGVVWLNDSKATNVSSTRVAVQSMTRPVILLLGGRHKGEPYSALIPDMKNVVRKVIAYGESADMIENSLKSSVAVERLGNDFEAVMQAARNSAQAGDAVLFSPACSSYDMFRNFEERGDRFRRLVEEMA